MEKNRNRKPTSLKDILRYLTRASSHRERNLMEKKMEQDAFLDDAVQGLSDADTEKVWHDILDINRRIKGRANETPVWFRMGIAASLALLVMAGLGYLYLEMSGREGMRDQLVVEQHQDRVLEDQQPEMERAEQDVLSEEPPLEKLPEDAVLKLAPEEPLPTPLPAPVPMAEAPPESPVIIAEVEEDYFEDAELHSPVAAFLSETNNRMEAAGAARSLAPEALNDALTDAIVEAEPQTGYALYNLYLEESALLDHATQLSPGVVKVTFEINAEGKPVNFEILESPDPELAERAIKIIENGVPWIPATKNGVFYIQRVELNIKFRKKTF